MLALYITYTVKTMFKDRKKTLGKKIDLESQKKFKLASIRNKNLGKWAAEKLGLEASKLNNYIDEVIVADFDEPGHEDVLRKISNDFNKANINISYDEIKEKLLNFEKDAIDKLSD